MFLVQHLFLIQLNVNTIVNKYFLSMKSKCVAAFKVGWLIFEQKRTSSPSYLTNNVTSKKKKKKKMMFYRLQFKKALLIL